MKVKIGAQPIIWSNDDFHELGGQTSLETCLREMREAGYEGTELGHKFPKDAVKLKKILDPIGLQLISGWHSSYILSRPVAEEEKDFRAHMDFLKAMGSKVVIIAECTDRTYHEKGGKIRIPGESSNLSEDQWSKLTSGLEHLTAITKENGMELAYHHHMGTVIQSESEVDMLMEKTKNMKLLFDTGHLTYAGANAFNVLKKHGKRVGHVHLKNIRPEIIKEAHNKHYDFFTAVSKGVFNIPGDGGIDYGPIFNHLKELGYQGWMVVEAEQDPAKANPFEYASRARKYIKTMIGV